MTVAELIAALETQDPDALAVIHYDRGRAEVFEVAGDCDPVREGDCICSSKVARAVVEIR